MVDILDPIFRIDVSRSTQNDRLHDQNTYKFIECIETSHSFCGPKNLIAIKVTALIRPSVLKKFNTILKSIADRSVLPSMFELINKERKKDKIVESFQKSINSQLTKSQVLFETVLNISSRIEDDKWILLSL